MMAQVNAGRVRFVGRGEYNNSTQYYVFDLVSYNGNSYYAKVDTIGHLPTDTTYWQLVAEKGNVGPTGLTGNGISSIEKTSASGLVDTYTITYTNGNTTTFNVSNGNGIDRIEKTATVGNKDTYTIYFTNGSTTTYEVSNGEVTREELEEEVDRLSMIYNAFPTTTGEGEEPSINGTAEVPFKEIGLKGNTSQESTTGKNILPNENEVGYTYTTNGITFKVNEDKSITVNGTATGTAVFDIFGRYGQTSKSITVDKDIIMSVSQTFKNVSLEGYVNGTTYLAYTGTSKTITISSPKSITNMYLTILKDKVINNVTVYPMIRYATITDDTYEPYTGGNPAPNPDYPYPVNVVTGDNEVKVEGKNLFNKNTEVDNYYIDASGNITANAGFAYSALIPVEQTNYVLKGTTYETSTKRIHAYNSSGTWIKQITYEQITANNDYSIPITINDSNIKYIRISIKIADTNVKVVKNSEIASYPINLGSMELCKIGDYQDSIVKDNGKWYLNKQIGKKVLVGTENWTYQDQYPRFILASISPRPLNGSNLFCSHYIKGQTADTNNVCSLASGTGYSQFLVHDERFSTKETYNTWLSSNNVLLYYVLATPTTTEITDTTLIEQLDNLEKAYSYDTQTNISQTNQDKPFIISYEAILSLRNVLNS